MTRDLACRRGGGLGVSPEMLAVSYAMAENTFAVTQTPPGETPRLDTINRALLQSDLCAEPVAAEHANAVVNDDWTAYRLKHYDG